MRLAQQQLAHGAVGVQLNVRACLECMHRFARIGHGTLACVACGESIGVALVEYLSAPPLTHCNALSSSPPLLSPPGLPPPLLCWMGVSNTPVGCLPLFPCLLRPSSSVATFAANSSPSALHPR